MSNNNVIIAACAAHARKTLEASPFLGRDHVVREQVCSKLGVSSLRSKRARELAEAIRSEMERQDSIHSARVARRKKTETPNIIERWLKSAKGRELKAEIFTEIRRYRLGERHQTLIHWTPAGTLYSSEKIIGCTEENRCYPYAGSWKSWSAKEYTHVISATPGGVRRAKTAGLLCIGGMITIDMDAGQNAGIYEDAVIRIHRAAWIEQGRGCSLWIVPGWIAAAYSRDGSLQSARHGDSPEQALRRLKSNLRPRASRTQTVQLEPPSVDEVRVMAEECPDAIVSIRDAKRLGYCDSGIRSWCYRAGLDIELERGYATLAKLAEAIERWYSVDAARLVQVIYRRTMRQRRRSA